MRLGDLITRVFPAGCEIAPAHAVPPSQRFAIIPGGDGPRWIMPVACRHSEKVLRQWSPLGALARAKWRIAMTAHRLNRIAWVPRTVIVGVANFDPSSWRKAGLTACADAVPVVYVARPSATQKAVVSLLSAGSGKIDRVIKIALGPAAWPFIERDYCNLQAVDMFCAGLAPKPLGLFPDCRMSSQEWIAGKTSLHLSPQSMPAFLMMLWQPDRTTLRELAQRYRARFDVLPRDDIAGWFERMIDSIQCDDDVPRAFHHGDFAAWNLIRQVNGGWRAVDWEFGDCDGAPLFDLFHFLLSRTLANGRLVSFQAASRSTLDAHDRIVRLFLNRLGASYRYARDALTLTFVSLYLTRFNSAWTSERLLPQLRAVAGSFAAGTTARRTSAH